MRKTTLFNNDWLFAAEQLTLDAHDSAFQAVTLPHSNMLFPPNNVNNLDYQFISTYRKYFELRADPENRVLLELDGVMMAAQIYLNNQLLKEHLGGFTAFQVDLSPAVLPGRNMLQILVDSHERKDIPPYGGLVDYLTFGGIYRNARLKILPPVYIENVFIKPMQVLSEPRLSCEVRLNIPTSEMFLEAVLLDKQGNPQASASGPLSGLTCRFEFPNLPQVRLWNIDEPVLYRLQINLVSENKVIDSTVQCFGFREARFQPEGGFYLNGRPLKLFGLDRHQTYPFIGAAAPARLQRQDADILKNELGCNIVRTSHYPQSPHFLERCDEIGLLVFEELPGWQHIGDAAWQQLSLDNLAAMIERDRNHPSIVLWGVRINESLDNDAFYTRTNALAHQLDPTRQTGGVRNFLGSSFLEDVYTYNDFSNGVIDPPKTPHLVTEFGGHMFPAKAWDHEERLIAHALLHARVQDLQMGNPRIAGAIGWCAFDYATHIEFGSGDRICYHGVMDTYRLPKWASYFYQSQLPPEQKTVLQAATRWTMGERCGGGMDPLTIFSNCEAVEVIIGEHSLGRFEPDRASYPHLPHPPFVIHGVDQHTAWNQGQFHDLHLVGYIADKPAAEQWIASDQLPKRLELLVDHNQIIADGSDMTRLVFRICDTYGNPLSFASKVIHFAVQGEVDLVGENPFPLFGGKAAIYIKARHIPGKAVVTATSEGLPSVYVTIEMLVNTELKGY